MGADGRCSIVGALLSHHLHDHALAALAVELGVKDALPGAEIELARCNGQNDFMMDGQRFEVRVAVGFASLVMAIVVAKRRQALQPLVNVLDQTGFVVVYGKLRR